MSLFDSKNKKGDTLKTLSENEIQSRLYGAFRKPHRDENLPTSHKASSRSQAPHDSSDASSSALPRKVSDLFSVPVQTTRLLSPESPKPDEDKKSGLSAWIHKEQEVVQAHADLKSVAGVGSSRISSVRQRQAQIRWGQSFGNSVSYALSFGKLCLARFVQVLFFIAGLLAIKRARKMRPQMVWLFASTALILIFIAISALNRQREEAMKVGYKTPKKTSAQSTVSDNTPQQPLASQGSEVLDSAKKSNFKIPEKSGVKSATSPSVPPAKIVPSQAADVLPYVIQVATYALMTDAEKKLTMVKAAGFEGFIQSLKRQSGRVYHCMFVGRYKTADEAESNLVRFKKQVFSSEFPDAFVRRLK